MISGTPASGCHSSSGAAPSCPTSSIVCSSKAPDLGRRADQLLENQVAVLHVHAGDRHVHARTADAHGARAGELHCDGAAADLAPTRDLHFSPSRTPLRIIHVLDVTHGRRLARRDRRAGDRFSHGTGINFEICPEPRSATYNSPSAPSPNEEMF